MINKFWQKIKSEKKIFISLSLILFLGAGLRFYHISWHDSYLDETVLAFRAIEMIDYDAAPQQPTPWQWFEEVPWWAHLSFHDHPVFFFLLQNLSIKIFGVTLFAVRFPSILAGLASIVMIFLVGKKLFGKKVGLLSAALLAVNSYNLFVSRLGLQESVVILLILASFYFLLQTKDNSKNWLWFWLCFGVGIITKYTILVIMPILLWYILLFKIKFYKDKNFWQGLIVFFLVTAPSSIYNLALYNSRGHFDFQLSAAFGQNVPEWQVRLGRNLVGGLETRFTYFFAAMHYATNLLFGLLTVVSIWVVSARLLFSSKIITKLAKIKKLDINKNLLFLFGSTFIFYLWFFVIGSNYRFVSMIVPFFILLISFTLMRVSEFFRNFKFGKVVSFAVLSIIFLVEFLFSYNSFLRLDSWGVVNITYAQINEETQNFGFNEVGEYLEDILENRVTYFAGQAEYQFLADLQTKRIKEKIKKGDKPLPIVIIFEKDLKFLPSLWYFQRHLIYDGWPVLSDIEFADITNETFDKFYKEQGVEKFIYIAADNEELLRKVPNRRDSGLLLENYLKEREIIPKKINKKNGEKAFLIYEF